MAAKDFYKILDVPASASQEEIKKAYRQLALKYHPDKNAGGKATENWFREIHEAYKTLNDPGKRSAYNQDRWYRESTVSGKAEPPKTPEQMLSLAARLAKHTRTIDKDRTNYLALQQYMLYLLSEENLAMLRQWNNEDFNYQIARELISASSALGYKRFIPVAQKLRVLVPGELLENALLIKKRVSWWRNYQLPVILLVAILLCLLIYYAGR